MSGAPFPWEVRYGFGVRALLNKPPFGVGAVDVVVLGVPAGLAVGPEAGRIGVGVGRGHRNRFAGPVRDLRAVEPQCAYGFRIFAVATAQRADVADVRGSQHRVECLDAVAEHFHRPVADVVRST